MCCRHLVYVGLCNVEMVHFINVVLISCISIFEKKDFKLKKYSFSLPVSFVYSLNHGSVA